MRELGRNLGRMTLQPEREPVSLRELGILKETVRMLESPYERVVLQAIDLLEQNAARLLDPRLPKLLAHASPRVRARALEYAASSPSLADRHHIAELVNDPDPMVRVIALRVRCALGGGRPLAALGEHLASENPEMRAAALACLVEQGREDELPQIRALIERMLSEGTCRGSHGRRRWLLARARPRPISISCWHRCWRTKTSRCVAQRSAQPATRDCSNMCRC